MEKASIYSATLRDLLRRQLNLKTLTYSDLAKNIQVSTPTIKRWMTKDEIPFDKLIKILSVLDLRLSDVEEAVAFKSPPPRPRPTVKDEMFIAKNPRESYVLLLISLGYGFNDILESLNISKTALEKIFLVLDRNQLIKYYGTTQFRSLIRPPLEWSANGPFLKTYLTPLLQTIWQEAMRSHEQKKNSVETSSSLKFGEVYMSRDLEIKFKMAIEECLSQHLEMARIEKKQLKPDKTRPIGFSFFISQFSPWKNVMWI